MEPIVEEPVKDVKTMAKAIDDQLLRAAEIYCKEGCINWSKAMIDAGYSYNYSRTNGYKLIEKERVRRYIADYKVKVEAKNALTLDLLKQKYLKLYAECQEMHDRTNAKGILDSLTRMLGGFTDKLAMSADKGYPPPMDIEEALAISRAHNRPIDSIQTATDSAGQYGRKVIESQADDVSVPEPAKSTPEAPLDRGHPPPEDIEKVKEVSPGVIDFSPPREIESQELNQ